MMYSLSDPRADLVLQLKLIYLSTDKKNGHISERRTVREMEGRILT